MVYVVDAITDMNALTFLLFSVLASLTVSRSGDSMSRDMGDVL